MDAAHSHGKRMKNQSKIIFYYQIVCYLLYILLLLLNNCIIIIPINKKFEVSIKNKNKKNIFSNKFIIIFNFCKVSIENIKFKKIIY